jgi:hypothetical protein
MLTSAETVVLARLPPFKHRGCCMSLGWVDLACMYSSLHGGACTNLHDGWVKGKVARVAMLL